MKKYVLVVIAALLWASGNAQKTDRKLKLIASRKGCVVNLIFKKNGSSINYIPDLSLRSDTIDGYRVLKQDLIEKKADTLIIILNSVKKSSEADKVIIS